MKRKIRILHFIYSLKSGGAELVNSINKERFDNAICCGSDAGSSQIRSDVEILRIDEKDARKREQYLKSGLGKKYIRNRIKNYLDNL